MNGDCRLVIWSFSIRKITKIKKGEMPEIMYVGGIDDDDPATRVDPSACLHHRGYG